MGLGHSRGGHSKFYSHGGGISEGTGICLKYRINLISGIFRG